MSNKLAKNRRYYERYLKAVPVQDDLTKTKIKRALEMRRERHHGKHLSWRFIAGKLGVRHYELLSVLDPAALERERASRRKRGNGTPKKTGYGGSESRPSVIPDSVLMERERYLATEHASLSAYILGDPKPGYSALDKKFRHEAAQA